VARTKATGEAKSQPPSPAPAAAPAPAPPPPPLKASESAAYTVVARRYRPQKFEDVVGQDHVVESLRNAIRMNRVTHAYLFSGTRGVGKTSVARIFAKCLNCAKGPSVEPDQTCDICRAIAAGQDVDVIEIDGASNNGVEQVRELRQNAGLRPSRSRFKIYYIDEVHMLSTGAFNALLKTLEEPPPHVKFFFATTEPNKIPVTVLSRCQRYDFAPIAPDLLVKTLAKICAGEGVEADEDALRVVARRAAGSMRDGESLLEQLLSSGGKALTKDAIHRALGIAPDDRVLELLDALADHDVALVLKKLDDAIAQGAQAVDVLNSTLEFLRDVMVVKANAPVVTLAVAPGQESLISAIAGKMSLETILAALQILDQARARLRGSPYGRLIVELALARAARLEDLAEIGSLIARLSALEVGGPIHSATAPLKKKRDETELRDSADATPRSTYTAAPEPSNAPATAPSPPPERPPSEPPPLPPLASLRPDTLWKSLLSRIGEPLRTHLKHVHPSSLEPPGVLVVPITEGYNWVADSCDTADNRARIDATLREIADRPLTIQFSRPESPVVVAEAPVPTVQEDLASDPLVARAMELFEARPVHIEPDDGQRG
jgi:DNA polymerase III subunit gamma/tau